MGQNWLDDLVPISRRMALLTHASANRAALGGIHPGMDAGEVRQRMGTKTRTGSSGYFTNIVLNNPHRRFVFESREGSKLEILLYLTDVEKLDGEWSPEQFTPMIFKKEILLGWGWDFLQSTRSPLKGLHERCRARLLQDRPARKQLPG